jgi:hypothetical protein
VAASIPPPSATPATLRNSFLFNNFPLKFLFQIDKSYHRFILEVLQRSISKENFINMLTFFAHGSTALKVGCTSGKGAFSIDGIKLSLALCCWRDALSILWCSETLFLIIQLSI